MDCHWRYNASDVVKVARELDPFRLMWLEDPVPPNNTAALKEVTSRVQVPIVTGRIFFFKGFQDGDCANTQFGDCHSPTCRKLEVCGSAGRCAVRGRAHDAGGAARHQRSGRHFGRSALLRRDSFLHCEFHSSEVPFWNDLVQGLPKPLIHGLGSTRFPENPGLGVTLNEEVARRYTSTTEARFSSEEEHDKEQEEEDDLSFGPQTTNFSRSRSVSCLLVW